MGLKVEFDVHREHDCRRGRTMKTWPTVQGNPGKSLQLMGLSLPLEKEEAVRRVRGSFPS